MSLPSASHHAFAAELALSGQGTGGAERKDGCARESTDERSLRANTIALHSAPAFHLATAFRLEKKPAVPSSCVEREFESQTGSDPFLYWSTQSPSEEKLLGFSQWSLSEQVQSSEKIVRELKPVRDIPHRAV